LIATFSVENAYSQSSDDFLTYTNSEYGYQFEYPSSWLKTETGDPALHVVITSPFENSDDEFTELAAAGAETLFIDIDLDAYTELSLRSLETPDFKVLDSSKISVSDNPAQMIIFSDKNEFGDDVKGLAVWLVSDKNGYFVMFVAEPAKYSEYLPIFEKMLDSYELDEKLKEDVKLELIIDDYSTYIDSVNKIKFEYPTHWSKLDLNTEGIITIITSPLEDYNDQYGETVVVGIEEIPFGLLSLEQYSELSIKNMASVPEFKILEQADTTLANLPAKKMVFSQVEPTYNIDLTTLTVWTIKDDMAYFMALGAEPAKYPTYLPIFEKIISSFEIGEFESPIESSIPDWIRNNAKWWAEGNIDDKAFAGGIQFLIKEGIIIIPETSKASTTDDSQEIPSWIKNNADWWSQGLISDDDFVKGIQFMVKNGIIAV
jgi:hypothetical protein